MGRLLRAEWATLAVSIFVGTKHSERFAGGKKGLGIVGFAMGSPPKNGCQGVDECQISRSICQDIGSEKRCRNPHFLPYGHLSFYICISLPYVNSFIYFTIKNLIENVTSGGFLTSVFAPNWMFWAHRHWQTSGGRTWKISFAWLAYVSCARWPTVLRLGHAEVVGIQRFFSG